MRLRTVVQTAVASLSAATAAGLMARADIDDRYLGALWGKEPGYGPAQATTVAMKGDRQQVARLVTAAADRHAVPRNIALAVTQIESGFRCQAIGPRTRHGRAHGPLQILPSSAARLGFPTTDLNSCGNGLAAGMAHLAQCYQLAGGDPVRTAACHVGGPGMASGPRGRYAQQYVLMVTNAMQRF